MRELFVELNRKHQITILFSSHSIGEVEKVSDRVAIVASSHLQQVLNRNQWEGPGSKPLENWFLDCIRKVL